MNPLEGQYRKAMRWFPASWRRDHEEALLGLLLDQAEAQGYAPISRADRRNLAWHGLRQRIAATPIAFIGALLVLSSVVAISALGIGAYPFGNAQDEALCRVTNPLPAVGGPYDAPDSRARAEHVWFPLGVVCTLDSQHDTYGPQVTHHQSWPATWTWLAATATALFTLTWLCLATGAKFRRRPHRQVG